MVDLKGKNALVTGASRGIGEAIVKQLAALGARVVVNHRDSETQATEVADAIREAGGEVIVAQGDVSRAEDAQRLISTALDAFGRLDILVNNAGTTRDMLVAMMKEEDWDTVIDTNLKGAYHTTKAALRPMMKQRYGRIVNITSIIGITGNAGQANYAAAKAGLIGFTKSVAREVGSRNITVNAVAPGLVPTELTNKMPADIVQKLIELTPLGRQGMPKEIAQAVAFLASDAASFISGQVLRVDGGIIF